MEDDYEHEDPLIVYAPSNVPGKGCDTSVFDDCFAGSIALGRLLKIRNN